MRLLFVDTHTPSSTPTAKLAEAALAHGYDVDYVCGDAQTKPSAGAGHNRLRVVTTTAETLQQTVQSLCAEKPDALIASVNDASEMMQAVKQAPPPPACYALLARLVRQRSIAPTQKQSG